MKMFGVWFFGLVFVLMGVAHFVTPDVFVGIMPKSWPQKETLNLLAGIAEIVFGLGYLIPKSRVVSGYLICVMLLAFWVLHGIHLVEPPKPEWPFWGYLLRFMLQPVLIVLVWKLKDFKGKP